MKSLFPIGPSLALKANPAAPFPLIVQDIYEGIRKTAKLGFDSVELHIRDPKNELDPYKVRDLCQENGLLVSSMGTGQAFGAEGLSITSSDSDVRNRAIRRLMDHVDVASIVGGVVIIGSMRGKIPDGSTFRAVNSLMLESMKRLIDYAEKKCVSFAIEAIDRFETNYLLTAESVLSLIDELGSSLVGVHLDSYHMNIEENDWVKPVYDCGNRLFHFHAADNTRWYPGSGKIPFSLLLDALQRVNYKGSLTLECFPFPSQEEACLKGIAYLRKVCDTVRGKQHAI